MKNTDNLVNIHWANQDLLKELMSKELLFTQTDTQGLFVKVAHSNILLNSAIHFKNVWVDKKEVGIICKN